VSELKDLFVMILPHLSFVTILAIGSERPEVSVKKGAFFLAARIVPQLRVESVK
jgi:membrane protein YdbS with pleckstrin-like domain